jgi:SAM-dependent MidA family methyltransferase
VNLTLLATLQKQFAQLQNQRALPFSDFMQTVLYTPEGYYNRLESPIGKYGDFITAPTLSPLFSHCLAKQYQALQIEVQLENIVEFGAGTGALAYDFIDYLEKHRITWNQYIIIEISDTLKEKQRNYLSEHLPKAVFQKISWMRLENLHVRKAMVIANEVLDAMPVNIFEITEQGIQECGVTYDGKAFHWGKVQSSSHDFNQTVSELASHYQLQSPYLSEVCLFMKPWFAQLSQALTESVIVLIDYGYPGHEYYHRDRLMGTLMCHHQHHSHPDPLIQVGEQDITAHVDFTAVAIAAENAGFDVLGYLEQSTYLLNLGLMDLAQEQLIHATNEKTQISINQSIKRLTLPHEMGELFKVMILSTHLPKIMLKPALGNKISRL